MTSEKQVEANRRNALRSTGPKTMEGKKVVARNATKHGILSTQVHIDDEEREPYYRFRESMINELGPRGEMESLLVDRIVSTAWRLRRVIHIEALMMQSAKEKYYGSHSYMEAFVGKASNQMAVLSRYERSLENTFFRAMNAFKELHGEREVEVLDVLE